MFESPGRRQPLLVMATAAMLGLVSTLAGAEGFGRCTIGALTPGGQRCCETGGYGGTEGCVLCADGAVQAREDCEGRLCADGFPCEFQLIGVCEDGVIQSEGDCGAKLCGAAQSSCSITPSGPRGDWIGERDTCTTPADVELAAPRAACTPVPALASDENSCSARLQPDDTQEWYEWLDACQGDCYSSGPLHLWSPDIAWAMRDTVPFPGFENYYDLDWGKDDLDPPGEVVAPLLCTPQVGLSDESECARMVTDNHISDWPAACEASGCVWDSRAAADTLVALGFLTCEWRPALCSSAISGVDENMMEAHCTSIFSSAGEPLCIFTEGVSAEVADAVDSPCETLGCDRAHSIFEIECDRGIACSRGTARAEQVCIGTATEIPANCTGTALPAIADSCTNGTAEAYTADPARCDGTDAFGTPCAVMMASASCNGAADAVPASCSDGNSTNQSTCAAADCGGMSCVWTDVYTPLCDLDAGTDGTADCPAGCSFTPQSEACASNTGNCSFVPAIIIVPICDLDSTTDPNAPGNSFGCPDGCIYTNASDPPQCDLDSATNPELGENCPNGCNSVPAVVPVCDLDVATDGSADCPAGCDTPSCLECVPGKYSDSSNSTSCIDCPAGTYNEATGSSASADCVPCVAGKYLPSSGSPSGGDCISCPAGQFQTMPGQPSCQSCRNGTYGSGAVPEGASSEEQECEACSPGKHDDDSDPVTPCTDCFPGRYSDTDSSTQCTACAAGRFLIAAGGSSPEACADCASGQWSDTGSVQCTPCEVRYFRVAVHELESAQAQLWSDYLGIEAEAGCLDCAIRLDGSVRDGLQCPEKGTMFPSAASGYYLEGSPSNWQQTVPPPDQISYCQPPQACSGGVGVSSCARGYSGPRCAVCDQGYYREGDLCPECPPGWPLALIVSLFCAFLLLVALVGDYLSSKYSRMSERVAPMMILMTYLQTTCLLLDVPLSWPPVLRNLINLLSVVNFNMDLAKPECSFPVDFKFRQIVTLATPVVFLGLTKAYMLIQLLRTVVVHSMQTTSQNVQVIDLRTDVRNSSEHVPLSLSGQLKKTVVRVKKQTSEVATGSFVVVSLFFLRTMVGGLDCSSNLNGKLYMDREPATECTTSNSYYAEVRKLSWIGLGVYAVVFAAVVAAMAKGGARRFHFLADKMHPKWFWWELVLLVRKVLIMVSALLLSEKPEQGWFLCSFVLVIAISLQSYARPFREDWLNLCEYCSLFSTLLLFMAGMVFKVQSMSMEIEDAAELADTIRQDSETGQEDEPLAPMARLLVIFSTGLILLTTTVCLYAELTVLKRCVKKSDSGKQREPSDKHKSERIPSNMSMLM